jgi:hypothetical protein
MKLFAVRSEILSRFLSLPLPDVSILFANESLPFEAEARLNNM